MKTNNTHKTRKAKKGLLFILLISLSFTLSAQRKLRDYLITGSSMFVSGMLDGTIESISYHYDNGFKKRFHNINNQFWDPSVSWQNKYKNGNSLMGPKFAGSTNMFVCTTDGYHMLRAAKRAVDGLTLAYYVNKECTNMRKSNNKKWKNIITDFLVLSAIRSVGFNLTYNLMFNPRMTYLQN